MTVSTCSSKRCRQSNVSNNDLYILKVIYLTSKNVKS